MTTATIGDRKRDTSIARSMLQEFEHEVGTTRKFLERIPGDQLGWRPHAKSLSIGQLGLHIATLPEGVFDLAVPDRVQAPNFGAFPQPNSIDEVLSGLDRSAAHVREALPKVSDERMHETFAIMKGDHAILTMPRAQFLRLIMLNHWYHHRGQLGVYLRLIGATVPSRYGPSGDESM